MKLKLAFVASLALVACSEPPSPVVVGTMAASPLRANDEAAIEINGEEHRVQLEDDGASFSMQNLPTGELEFRVDVEGITGTLEVHDVQPGELIDIDVSTGPGRLELSVIRRDRANPDDYGMLPPRDDDIVIRGNHVVHHLEPGEYGGDIIIEGNHVTLVGPNEYGCREGGRAVLLGDLIIRGNKIKVINVETRGRVEINGNHTKIYRPCDRWRDRGDDDDDDDRGDD